MAQVGRRRFACGVYGTAIKQRRLHNAPPSRVTIVQPPSPFRPPRANFKDVDKPEPSELLNPWLMLWIQPRTCARQLLSRPRTTSILILTFCAGMSLELERAMQNHFGEQMSLASILFCAGIGGFFRGLFNLYFCCLFLSAIGRLMGGRASMSVVFRAIGWSQLPALPILVLWLPLLIASDSQLFTHNIDDLNTDTAQTIARVLIRILQLALSVWGWILAFICIKEAHGFLASRALLSMLITAVMYVIFLVALALLLRLIT